MWLLAVKWRNNADQIKFKSFSESCKVLDHRGNFICHLSLMHENNLYHVLVFKSGDQLIANTLSLRGNVLLLNLKQWLC